jgi:carboxymethylenebutenolidase
MTDVTHQTLDSRHDGRTIAALRAQATRETLGGMVVIQEIFGLTDHVSDMCATFADAGFDTIAPALFERIEPGFLATHDEAGFAKGRAAVFATPWAQAMGDVQAAIEALPQPCFIVGFCYGGAVAWRAAAECTGLSGAACFYGRLITDMLDLKPEIPIMLHYGARDASIPFADIERVRVGAPDAQLYLYENAGHGFCRAGSADYDARARELALKRTLDVFTRICAV